MRATHTASTLEVAAELSVPTQSKIILLVLDGLGGLPRPEDGLTELEAANLPNLGLLAMHSDVGLTEPFLPGVTVGSGPGHLALFGYDPLQFPVGRGVTTALGIDFPLEPGDVAARINFASVDSNGLITNRRAGRISDEEGERLCRLLRRISLDGVKVFVQPEKGHRALVVFRGEGLSDRLADSDPQHEGVPVAVVVPLEPEAAHVAGVANDFIRQALALLSQEAPANAVLLRGFSSLPKVPPMSDVYRLRAAAVSAFPTYRGIARSVGMTVLEAGDTLVSGVEALEAGYQDFDFFYLHAKWTDSAGEDGDFEGKVRALEQVDAIVPRLRALQPDVLAVGGDHSCPSAFREHTWHPVPFLIHSRWSIPSGARLFSERECARGNLGVFSATRAMLLMLGHAGKLSKFGA